MNGLKWNLTFLFSIRVAACPHESRSSIWELTEYKWRGGGVASWTWRAPGHVVDILRLDRLWVHKSVLGTPLIDVVGMLNRCYGDFALGSTTLLLPCALALRRGYTVNDPLPSILNAPPELVPAPFHLTFLTTKWPTMNLDFKHSGLLALLSDNCKHALI